MINNKSQFIGIDDLIFRIRNDLLKGVLEEQNPLFAVSSVELEISFTVERNLTGGFDLQVVQSGAEKSTSEVQKINLTLVPLATLDEIRQSLSVGQKKIAQKALTRGSKEGK